MWRLIGVINKGPDKYSLWERDETDGLRTYSVTERGEFPRSNNGWYRLSTALRRVNL